MGKNSVIEWTHHTFNPWWGCTKISPACKHCYAEAWSKRVGVDVWGARASRRFFGDGHWREPIRWNAEAACAGMRRRVFCASMSDVFEHRAELNPWRERLWHLIDATPWLDWLLLTKRPERVAGDVPWRDQWPANVWLGTTAENQLWADRRIPSLIRLPAVVRFVSCEPVLGPIDLSGWFARDRLPGIDWVIAGGESGSRARPMHSDWPRLLRDQCIRAGVAFHFKQWGNWRPDAPWMPRSSKRRDVIDSHGRRITLVNVGKRTAGRDLDGQTWDQLPRARHNAPPRLRVAAG